MIHPASQIIALTFALLVAPSLKGEPADSATARLWRGSGSFAVVYDDVQYRQNCSFVLVQLIESVHRVQLSTRYNCEDDEDQEFVPLTLDRRGAELFYGETFVGLIQDQNLALELRTGRQIETYRLDFRGDTLKFQHTSELGTPGRGVLSAELFPH